MKLAATSRLKRPRRGATATEYVMILALVVIPMALAAPMLIHMVTVYTFRIGWVIRMPFG